jgi:glycosyltransferase involved in cell wall biosynthesis
MQEYPRADFEVIVVNNGSTDDTREMLSDIHTNYTLNSISINKNMGRAFARNYGVKRAKGDIIIFHDSDMIAEGAFIAKHLEAHRSSNIAVCGQSWERIYTYYYEDFKGYLKRNMYHQLGEDQILGLNHLRDKQALISKSQILSGDCFQRSFYLVKMFQAEQIILNNYGNSLKGYYFPWSLLVTNNCSLEKSLFYKVDGFDNSYVEWGCEDLDFGYRLYKSGCNFIKDNAIRSIHQEHPISYIDRGEQNILYFTRKYENIDLLLFYYGYFISVDKTTANEIMKEIEKIDSMKYGFIIEIYRKLLIALRNKNIRVNASEKDWFYEIRKLKTDMISQMETFQILYHSLKNEGVSANLINSFDLLIKKVFNINFEHLN